MTTTSDLEALERFVVEEEDLAELEAHIGRFNIFDALGVARVEIRHSNCLAWLLDPGESHGQGDLFLRSLLIDLLRKTPTHLRPFSPVELDGTQLRGVEVRREWRHVDILIACQEPPFVLAVENKVDSGEHGGQLGRYELAVGQGFPKSKPLFVFLTKDAAEPSSERWVAYGYADVHRVLERCRRANHSSIGGDVAVFLDHYLGLIGSRFMDDPKIDELCRRIYRNHRRALDLIYERAGAPAAALIGELEDVVRAQPERWALMHRTPSEVNFVPKAWLDSFPSIGTYSNGDPRAWLRLGFWSRENKVTFWCYLFPTSDPAVRRRAVERLITEGRYGIRSGRKVIGDQWSKLMSETVFAWPEEEEPDREAVRAAAAAKLDEAWQRFASVPEVLAPIFAPGPG